MRINGCDFSGHLVLPLGSSAPGRALSLLLYIISGFHRRRNAKIKRGRILFFPSAFHKANLLFSVSLDCLDLTAIVVTAFRAHSVRHMQRAALGALDQRRSGQLPDGAASLVASCFGYFSLRYCHFRDTSLVSNCTEQCTFSEFFSFVRRPAAAAWPARPAADPLPFCSRRVPRSGPRRKSGTGPCSLPNKVFLYPY